MVIKYLPVPTFSITRFSKIYANCDFWFENKPSGNPVRVKKMFFFFKQKRRRKNYFPQTVLLMVLSLGFHPNCCDQTFAEKAFSFKLFRVHYSCVRATVLKTGVARFLFVQHTKEGKNGHKKYRTTTKYTNSP
jgi:hypothetical protein